MKNKTRIYKIEWSSIVKDDIFTEFVSARSRDMALVNLGKKIKGKVIHDIISIEKHTTIDFKTVDGKVQDHIKSVINKAKCRPKDSQGLDKWRI